MACDGGDGRAFRHLIAQACDVPIVMIHECEVVDSYGSSLGLMLQRVYVIIGLVTIS